MRHVAFIVVITLATGCFQTRIGTKTNAPLRQDRQWFLVNGLVNLSGETSTDCANGMAYAESRLGFKDILIATGIGFVGGLVGGVAVCDTDAEGGTYAACVSASASLASYLLQTRTVEYQCK
jgi:hypothetical protein